MPSKHHPLTPAQVAGVALTRETYFGPAFGPSPAYMANTRTGDPRPSRFSQDLSGRTGYVPQPETPLLTNEEWCRTPVHRSTRPSPASASPCATAKPKLAPGGQFTQQAATRCNTRREIPQSFQAALRLPPHAIGAGNDDLHFPNQHRCPRAYGFSSTELS